MKQQQLSTYLWLTAVASVLVACPASASVLLLPLASKTSPAPLISKTALSSEQNLLDTGVVVTESKAQPLVPISEIPHISEIERPLTNAQGLAQEPIPTQADDSEVLQVTGVQLIQLPPVLKLS